MVLARQRRHARAAPRWRGHRSRIVDADAHRPGESDQRGVRRRDERAPDLDDAVCRDVVRFVGRKVVARAPSDVRRRLEHEKKFTAKADVGVVDELYRDFFKGAADSATQLDFSGLGWGEGEAKQLEGVLPHFTQLKTLDLSSNKLGAAGASAIASLLKTTQISSLKCASTSNRAPSVRFCVSAR